MTRNIFRRRGFYFGILAVVLVVERTLWCSSFTTFLTPNGRRIESSCRLLYTTTDRYSISRPLFLPAQKPSKTTLWLSNNNEKETSVVLSAPTRLSVRPYRSYQVNAPRKPRGYWMKRENLERELRNQWIRALTPKGATQPDVEDMERLLPSDKPPPIPNYTLVRYWNRIDLDNILQNEGFGEIAKRLGGALMIPGKWKEAVKLPLVQRVVELDNNLSIDQPPPSPQQKRTIRQNMMMNEKPSADNARSDETRLRQLTDRKPNGYWNKTTVLTTL
jgi:hypothetical protein